MLFQEGRYVPFFISIQERVVTQFSQCCEPQLKYDTKYGLPDNIKSAGVYISVVKGEGGGYLQDIAH